MFNPAFSKQVSKHKNTNFVLLEMHHRIYIYIMKKDGLSQNAAKGKARHFPPF